MSKALSDEEKNIITFVIKELQKRGVLKYNSKLGI